MDRNLKILLTGAAIPVFCLLTSAHADNTRVTNPNALTAEVGGRGLLYSLGFDRVLSEQLSAGVSIGSVPMNNSDGTSSGLTATLVPVFINFYFAEEMSSPFLTFGVNWVLNSGSVSGLTSSPGNIEFSTSPLQPTFGLGWEYRSDPGFLVRVTAYGIYGNRLAPWGGLTLGYSF